MSDGSKGTDLDNVAKRCGEKCFGSPEGQGAKLKTTVDQWTGALVFAAKLIGITLALLASVVAVAIAIAPFLVRSSVSASVTQIVPGLVEASVSEALRRHGIAEQQSPRRSASAVVLAPPSPWLIPQAHAATKGSQP